jgi:predicted DNA-binding transcriptional regulator AlpA
MSTPDNKEPDSGDQLLRYADLKAAGIPLSRQHINTLEARGQFPQRIRLSERVIAWRQADVRQWLATRGRE